MTLFDPRVWLAVLVALGLSYGAGRFQQHRVDAQAYQAERTALALDAAQAQIKAVDEARNEEQRRTNEFSEIANAAKQQADNAAADAGSARAESGRLRQQLAVLVAAGKAVGDSATAGGSSAAGDPLDVLADVLSRADQRAAELAEFADRAHIAGKACESAYGALIWH